MLSKNNLNKNKIVKSNNFVNDSEFYKLLDKTIENFFPSDGGWNFACFKRPNDTLQSNLRNNKFLAKKIQHQLNLSDSYYLQIYNYINSSNTFKQKVHEYEQKIVKWQIEFMNNNGENWICDNSLGGDISLMMPNCDIAFRKGVVDTLLAMGLDREAIEEGLEKNADMWRDYYMERAFKIQFKPNSEDLMNIAGPYNGYPRYLPKVDKEHRIVWLRMRKYQYYCEHKKSVDAYGVVERDMVLFPEELAAYTEYLDKTNKERLDLIEKFRNLNESHKEKVIKLKRYKEN